ncbi:MAG: metal ABC transporter permease [Phycisphaerales bacterium]|nr:metal ABC transporter permease [Phycisphaerales bacterium]
MNILPAQWSADYDGWILVVVMLAAAACAIPGCYLLIRRQSMLGDAVSHSVLPGIALGFLISGTRSWEWMFLGAAVAGIATAVLAQLLQSLGRVERGAALGVVFTTLFALGLVLIRQTADHVELDPSCVLYGQVELAPLDTVEIFNWSLPRAVLVLGVVLLVGALLAGVLWKELLIASFDPEVSASQGVSPMVVQQLLMVLVAATCVAAFETVGSILVVALLVGPPATARLLTDRLVVMVPLAVVLGGVAAALGHLLAIAGPGNRLLGVEDTSIAGMIAVVAGAMVVVAAVCAPRHGVVSRFLNRMRLRLRIVEEDLLGVLYRKEVEGRGGPTLLASMQLHGAMKADSVGGRWILPLAIRRLAWRGMVSGRREDPTLTSQGRDAAQAIVRAHRLWERYLAGHINMPLDHLHQAAMDLEHVTPPDLERFLEDASLDTDWDPHGREIPQKSGPDTDS